MNKTRIGVSLVFFIAVVSGVYLLTSSDDPASVKPSVNEYPSMQVSLMDGKQIPIRSLTGNNILIFFQTDCDHCQREAEEISENLELFSAYELYFITVGNPADINKFAEDYGLQSNPKIKFVQTTVDQILNGVGPISTPSVYIFKGGKLVKELHGETPVAEMRPWL